jgi:prepilin-type N-terminal cleavage/methylation domain-containing protein
MLQRYRRSGFTIIELLVVLGIIAIILSLSLAAVSNARIRSRDARRVADLRTIQSALEQHALGDASHSYPSDTVTPDYCNGRASGIYNNSCFNAFLSTTPKDPQGQPYAYYRGACLTPGSGADTSRMVHSDSEASCLANGQKFGVYGLQAKLESLANPEGKNDASPDDPTSYDILP